MKKNKFKNFWGILIITALLTPVITFSAMACTPEIKLNDKNKIILNTNPVNGTIFLNQEENLPVLSIQAKVNNQNAQLKYQWYESDTNSTTSGRPIPGATQSTYTIPKSYAQKVGTKYFYAVVNSLVDGAILSSEISNIYTINVNQIPTININTHLVNQTVFVGTTNLPTFSVVVNDIKDTKLTYQWYESDTNSITGGMIISGANQPTYTVNSNDVKTSGTKYYYVKISGMTNNGIELAPVVSNTATLDVNPLPKINITSQSQNADVFVNQTTNLPTFSVTVDDIKHAKLTYQWYSTTNTTGSNNDWQLISGATNSSYTVPASDAKRVGPKHYYVKISGSINGMLLGSVNSNVATLRVNVPGIVIQKQPFNQSVTQGTTNLPTFSVTVNPIQDAELKYKWYSTTNTTGSNNDWHLINGANSSSYTVPASDVKRVGSKHYYVQVSGVYKGANLIPINSNVGTLRVDPLPTISITNQPINKTVISWTSNLPTFSVGVNPIQGAQLKYQWYSATGSNNDWQLISGATNSSYTVPASDVLIPGTQKHYYVEINGTLNGLNLATINSNVATLIVNSSPNITISHNPQNTTWYVNKAGQTAPVFSVTATSNVPNVRFRYQWYKNEVNSLSGATPIVGANSSSYTVPDSDLWGSTWGPRKLYYYVIVSGSTNGVDIVPVTSGIAVLTITRYM